jgi:Flp pilus assembly pilin Flp
MNLFRKLWKDDAGTVGLEYLLVATIVGLGIIVGLAAVDSALNTELTELANAILALSQGYQIANQSNCKACKQGSSATDTPTTIPYGVGSVECAGPVDSNIDDSPCGT